MSASIPSARVSNLATDCVRLLEFPVFLDTTHSVVLIDSGATHSFIKSDVVAKLNVPVA